MTDAATVSGSGGMGPSGAGVPGQVAETTGRYLVVFADDVQGGQSALGEALRSVTGVTEVASSLDFEARALDMEQADAAEATMFAGLGVAVVAVDPGRLPPNGRLLQFLALTRRACGGVPLQFRHADMSFATNYAASP